MRLRVRLAKRHQARFLSHLDLQRTLERALRRSGLPVAYTKGFSPHPRVSFAGALSTGASSEGEFLDIELDEAVDPAQFTVQANRFFPPGLQFLEARPAREDGQSLMSLIDAAEYRLTLTLPAEASGKVREAVAAFLGMDLVEVPKENKHGVRLANIRPQVYLLEAEGVMPGPGSGEAAANLRAIIQYAFEANLKPADLLNGLKLVEPGLAGAAIALTHRLMTYRRNPETGDLVLPWDL